MSSTPNKSQEQVDLRQQAERLLSEGGAPTTGFGALAPDALHLLYRMASNADSASDALKLLHELQAHQVELDMQQAQSEANEAAMEQELQRYRALFDHAPIAYFVLDASGRILEANRPALAMMNFSSEAIEGKALQDYCVTEDRGQLAELLTRIKSEQSAPPVDMRLQCGTGSEQYVRVLSAVGDGGEAILLALIALDDAPANA